MIIIFIIANILALFLPGIETCAPTSVQPMVPLQPASSAPQPQPAPAPQPQPAPAPQPQPAPAPQPQPAPAPQPQPAPAPQPQPAPAPQPQPAPAPQPQPAPAPQPQPAPAPAPQSNPGRKRRETPKLPFSIRLETNFPYDSRLAKNNQNLLKLIIKLKSVISSANLPPRSINSFSRHFGKTANGHLMIVLANRKGMDAKRCEQFVELGRKAIEATDLLKSIEINCGGNLIKFP